MGRATGPAGKAGGGRSKRLAQERARAGAGAWAEESPAVPGGGGEPAGPGGDPRAAG